MSESDDIQDRLREAYLRVHERQMKALVSANEIARRMHSRDWISFDWDARELVEGT